MTITARSITTNNTLEQLRNQFNNLVSDVDGLETGTKAFSTITATDTNTTTLSVLEDGTIVSKTVDISESPSGFHRFDAIFSLQIRNQKNLTTNLRLIAQNILNTDYRDYLNRMRYYSSELGRNLQIQLNFNY